MKIVILTSKYKKVNMIISIVKELKELKDGLRNKSSETKKFVLEGTAVEVHSVILHTTLGEDQSTDTHAV
jgi:hypothetical protein